MSLIPQQQFDINMQSTQKVQEKNQQQQQKVVRGGWVTWRS